MLRKEIKHHFNIKDLFLIIIFSFQVDLNCLFENSCKTCKVTSENLIQSANIQIKSL